MKVRETVRGNEMEIRKKTRGLGSKNDQKKKDRKDRTGGKWSKEKESKMAREKGRKG